MRFLLTFLMVLSVLTLTAQQGNPFELTARLPAGDSSATREVATTGNPFDLVRGAAATEAGPAGEDRVRRSRGEGPLVIQPVDPGEGRGSLLAIQLMLLLGLAGLWLLFGDTLRACFKGMLNDGLLNQLYNRRAGGALTALWVPYVYFFFAAGFHLYLLARYYGVGTGQGVWGGWLTFSLVVAAGLGVKNMVLTFYAGLFPVRREVSRYLFAVMVFCILAGLFITPINLLASYAPQGYRWVCLHAGIVVLTVVYLLHLLRGVFIANKLVASQPLHILLYICVVEIVPLLLIYRYLSDTLA